MPDACSGHKRKLQADADEAIALTRGSKRVEVGVRSRVDALADIATC